MVLRIGANGTGLAVFFQTTQDVSESFTTGNSPITGAVLSTHIRCPFTLEFLGDIRRIDGGIIGQVGQFECCRAVGYESIGKQDNRCHVLKSHLTCLICCIKTVNR